MAPIKGYLERIEPDFVKGWVHVPKSRSPIRVRVMIGDRPIGEGLVDLDRPDVGKALNIPSNNLGFRVATAIATDEQDKIVAQACSEGGRWVEIPRLRSVVSSASYQDFDGTGASKSAAKLAALRLDELRPGDKSIEPLAGKSVLDIGCNEGYFCAEAVRQGATRVLGVDSNKAWLEKAHERVPGAEFLHGSWWDIPNEKFDVIFFLSAIHYEPRQKELLRKLSTHLTDDGVLILECGVKGVPGKKQWSVIPRWDGPKRYPSLDLLREDLLSDYGVRWIGPSVQQAGDPVPRYVIHCRLRTPVAMIIAGYSRAGKTALAQSLRSRGVPHYDSDTAIAKLLMHEEYAATPLSKSLLKKFGKGEPKNLALVGNFIVENDLENLFCEMVAQEAPVEAGLFTIEGEIFRHPKVREALIAKLDMQKIRAWVVERGN